MSICRETWGEKLVAKGPFCLYTESIGEVSCLVFESIQSFLAELLACEETRITLSTVVMEDLEAEPSDLLDLMLLLEQEYAVQWTEKDLKNLKTVGDFVAFVENQI